MGKKVQKGGREMVLGSEARPKPGRRSCRGTAGGVGEEPREAGCAHESGSRFARVTVPDDDGRPVRLSALGPRMMGRATRTRARDSGLGKGRMGTGWVRDLYRHRACDRDVI